jgi:hypothetical protein
MRPPVNDVERTKGVEPLEPGGGGTEELPYVVAVSDGHTQRVVGRVMSQALAHAIFRAACQEYPTLSVRLTHGGALLSESGKASE